MIVDKNEVRYSIYVSDVDKYRFDYSEWICYQ
jgi:hypothetical protein